jgi:hypothetical protein
VSRVHHFTGALDRRVCHVLDLDPLATQ